MHLKIHGDNIVECERALVLIATAFGGTIHRISNNVYFPSFEVRLENHEPIRCDLLAGHGRWNVSIHELLAEFGAPLREATDAYITRVADDGETEDLIFAVEFCNALPAGNNAWQRNGRAIACAEIGVPYIYYAEIGGVELDSARNVKAPRFPNPLVPFSYLTASYSLNTICVPIYAPHPAITPVLRARFQPVFGGEDGCRLIRAILDGADTRPALDDVVEKGNRLVKILAGDRRVVDTLEGAEWDAFLDVQTGIGKAEYLEENHPDLTWTARGAVTVVVSESFQQLKRRISALNCLSVGARTVPICLITPEKLPDLIEIFNDLYEPDVTTTLVEAVLERNEHLLIVWVTGFKPRGDDSRPDRGLVALARMLFGNDISLLTIVSGPAYAVTWRTFHDDLAVLVRTNGLWQAINNLSDYIFVDSTTSQFGPLFRFTNRNLIRQVANARFRSSNDPVFFSEHDTDTATHLLVSNQEDQGIFESMCNPPGGDWSGITIYERQTGDQYRWTSLPRVSGDGGKRPDHVIQFVRDNPIFLAIESKNRAVDLEANIGTKLMNYVTELFQVAPTAQKEAGGQWHLSTGACTPLNQYTVYSGGAFCFRNVPELEREILRGGLDFVFAFEFRPDHPTIMHLKATEQCRFLEDVFTEIATQFVGGLEIQIH
jgi:hypothetical protein